MMRKSYQEINGELLDAQKAWEKILVDGDSSIKQLKDPDSKGRCFNTLSFPFYFGISDKYGESHKKKIMIIGQETGGGFDFRNSNNEKIKADNKPEASQKWTYTYNEDQRVNGSNQSPFWSFIRHINAFPDCISCYNNVDKIHFSKISEGDTTNSNSIIPIPLSYKAEKLFSASFDFNGEIKPLLLREICILKRYNLLDAIVFTTGPYYDQTMEWALGLNRKTLRAWRPTDDTPLRDVSEEIQLAGIKVFWTYHPNYLRLKRKESMVLDTLFKQI